MQIGQFIYKGTHYEGQLTTLSVTTDITLEPNKNKSDKAPDFKAFHGTREIGYAYKESFESQDDGRVVEFLNVKLDDPAFAYPIYGRIITSTEREILPLTWNRPKPKKA